MVNGDKNPNQIGRDTFTLYVLPEKITPQTKDDCYLNDEGWSCALYILQNSNMKYPKTNPNPSTAEDISSSAEGD